MGKKYKKGYIAGVFDLFHVGHVNLVRRAKEECDYLIVGVLSDDLVMHFKKKAPYISQEERRQMLESCRYVDEAVIVTEQTIEKMKAWDVYRFDCLFSGDDYSGNPYWEEDKRSLNAVGSNIEFFPYTKSTSSTMIKKLIQGSIGQKDEENQ